MGALRRDLRPSKQTFTQFSFDFELVLDFDSNVCVVTVKVGLARKCCHLIVVRVTDISDGGTD